jgi:large subunit ribosomal protein L18
MITRYSNSKLKRKRRVRARLMDRTARPRLVVTRTNKHIYAQIIDAAGKTLFTVSDVHVTDKKKTVTKVEKANLVGLEIGKLAKSKKINQVAFDRSYYKYHGRIKALADAARASGLEF